MSLKQDTLKFKTLSQQLGQRGEDLVADYLQKQGFTIRVRNYRYKKAEIDLIVNKGDCLVFVEVKARSSHRFGYPESFLGDTQQELIREAAEHYLIDQGWDRSIRFDIIAVLHKDGLYEMRHFKDAF